MNALQLDALDVNPAVCASPKWGFVVGFTIISRLGDDKDVGNSVPQAACSIVIIANSVHLAILSDDQIVCPGGNGLMVWQKKIPEVTAGRVLMFLSNLLMWV